MNIADRLSAMTSDLPQPITVGELHRFAPDAQDRRRLSFTVAAGDRSLAEVAVIPDASGAPQEHIDAFAQALISLLRGSEGRVEDAEARLASCRLALERRSSELCVLRGQLADFEQGRSVRGEFFAIEGNGGVWLQGRPSGAAFGLWFKGWADLARERPGLRPCGAITVGGGEKPLETYVVMRPIADLEPAL